MPALSLTRLLITLARAAGKAATAKIRAAGFTAESGDWAAKAEVCERCPIRVVKCNVSYCGQPLLRQVARDPALDGCGCPTRAKAKDPAEHCPITPRHEPVAHALTQMTISRACQCKWCVATRPQILAAAA